MIFKENSLPDRVYRVKLRPERAWRQRKTRWRFIVEWENLEGTEGGEVSRSIQYFWKPFAKLGARASIKRDIREQRAKDFKVEEYVFNGRKLRNRTKIPQGRPKPDIDVQHSEWMTQSTSRIAHE